MSIDVIPSTSFLKWAGGKRRQIPDLLLKWRSHENYRFVDLTCGAANVALGLAPGRALLNDINPHLINLFKQVQSGLFVQMKMRHDKDFYLNCRDQFNELIADGKANTPEAAALFYYLNRSGFNGLCRFNASGYFNVPFGNYKTVNYLSDFTPYKAAFRGWEFCCGDYSQVALEPCDFVYADPPYDSVDNAGFTSYSAGRFTWDDQVRLAKRLAAHSGPALTHNAATPRIVELYQDLGFAIEIGIRRNSINSKGDGRGPVPEMLAWRCHAA